MSQITPELRRSIVQISAELSAACDGRTPEGRNVHAAIESLMVAMDECFNEQNACLEEWHQAREAGHRLTATPGHIE